jgi:hypothetical protein
LNCNDLPLINWKVTPNPGSGGERVFNRFRLISPALEDAKDYNRCAVFLQKVQAIPSINVNSNTGFRLHVSAQGLKCDGLVILCQQFIKYEDAIDSILPPTRRSRSVASNSYFKSNKSALHLSTKKERNVAIANCSNTEQLIRLLNHDGKCYKLNLCNLSRGQQHPMIEFRSHSSTSNKLKIQSWVGLCLSIVGTAEEGSRNPAAFKESRTLEEEFEGLLKNIIKQRIIRDFFERRNKAGPFKIETGVKRAGGKKNSGKTECRCCFQKFNVDTMCACQEKKHWFCKHSCVRQYAKIQIFTNLESRLQCISTEVCSSDLNTIHLQKILPRKTLEKLRVVELNSVLERNKKTMRCVCS